MLKKVVKLNKILYMGDCYASSILKNGEKNFQFEVGELVTIIELLLHFLYVLILKQNSKKKSNVIAHKNTFLFHAAIYSKQLLRFKCMYISRWILFVLVMWYMHEDFECQQYFNIEFYIWILLFQWISWLWWWIELRLLVQYDNLSMQLADLQDQRYPKIRIWYLHLHYCVNHIFFKTLIGHLR